MAGASGSLPTAATPSVPGLPVPKIRVAGGNGGVAKFEIPQEDWTGNTTTAIMNLVTVAVADLPHDVKVQLELLRYSRRNASAKANTGHSAKQRAWVHPSHAPNPVPGHWTRGGTHSAIGATVASLRQTEWSVVNTDVVDVTQAMLGFISTRQVAYRSPAAAPPFDPDMTIDGISTVARGKMRRPGRRFAYAPAFHPGVFAFRYSVVDPNDPRGSRVSGPMSQPVFVHTAVFPFVVDEKASAETGYAMATIDPAYDPSVLRAWIGSVTRLP